MFIDKAINSKIIIILAILSIGLSILPTSGNGLASTQILNQNSTNVTQIPSSQTQQPQENQLQPFTIPRDNNENSRDSSTSGFTKTNNSNEDNVNDDIVLLSQNYDNDRFADHLVGELLNNGSETAGSVQVAASFYDKDGTFLGTASGFTEPSSIPSGGRAGFDILITSDTVQDDTETYEFSIQWSDDDFNQHTIRITGAQAEGNDDDNNDNNDNSKTHITITTSTLSQPKSDPRNDPKYDSIDWQDDDPSKNLSIKEMDKILEDQEKDNDSGGSDSGGSDSGGSDSGGSDSGGSDSGGSDSGGSDSGGSDSGGSDSGGSDSGGSDSGDNN